MQPAEEEEERLTEVIEIESSAPPTQESVVEPEELRAAYMRRPAAAMAPFKKPAKGKAVPKKKPGQGKARPEKKSGEGKGWQLWVGQANKG